MSPAAREGVNVLGRVRSEKGVGEACRSTLRSLKAVGFPMVVNDWHEPESVNLEAPGAELSPDNPYPVNLLHANAVEFLFIDRLFPGYRSGRRNVGYWNWELPAIPDDQLPAFHGLTEVFAPSRFTAGAIAARSPVPVRTIPFSVVAPAAPTLTRAHFGLPDGPFVFLSIFDLQSCLDRKNPLGLIAAFRRAFGRRRDVMLVLKVRATPDTLLDRDEILVASGGQPNIRVLERHLSRDEVHALVQSSDAVVSLHRSEGFGLVLAEAMAMGKPVVATNYSANVDFMNPDNSLLVDYRLVPVQNDWGPYQRGQLWADPDLDHAAGHLRRLVDDRALGPRLGAQARRDIERDLSPLRVGQILREHLSRLCAG